MPNENLLIPCLRRSSVHYRQRPQYRFELTTDPSSTIAECLRLSGTRHFYTDGGHSLTLDNVIVPTEDGVPLLLLSMRTLRTFVVRDSGKFGAAQTGTMSKTNFATPSSISVSHVGSIYRLPLSVLLINHLKYCCCFCYDHFVRMKD